MSTPPPPSDCSATLVLHHGRPVAIVTANRAWIIHAIDSRPAGDPLLRVVAAECHEAMEILRGERPGPYDPEATTRRAIARVYGPTRRMRRRPGHLPSR